jgi:hypothetical protein
MSARFVLGCLTGCLTRAPCPGPVRLSLKHQHADRWITRGHRISLAIKNGFIKHLAEIQVAYVYFKLNNGIEQRTHWGLAWPSGATRGSNAALYGWDNNYNRRRCPPVQTAEEERQSLRE